MPFLKRLLVARVERISRTALRALRPGEKLTARGIIAEVLEGGDVRYSVQVMVDGERIARVLGRQSEGVTPKEAERFLESIRTRARELRLELPKGRKTALSFAEAAPRYLQLLESGAGKNVARKRQHLRTYLIPHFGRHRLNAVPDTAVEAYVQQRKEASAAASTINGELATLSHLLTTAVKAKWIGRDSLPEIPRLRPSKAGS